MFINLGNYYRKNRFYYQELNLLVVMVWASQRPNPEGIGLPACLGVCRTLGLVDQTKGKPMFKGIC